jgi:DNA-directed RNA polymerase subunit RPC12/RpoP
MDTDHKTMNQEDETQESAQCPHCGSMKDPWFSRVMPMSYHCQDCGKDVDAAH